MDSILPPLGAGQKDAQKWASICKHVLSLCLVNFLLHADPADFHMCTVLRPLVIYRRISGCLRLCFLLHHLGG